MGNGKDPRVDDLLSQIAAQDIQLENKDSEIEELNKRLDTATGALESKTEELKKVEQKIREDGDESVPKLKRNIQALVEKNARLQQERKDAVSPERIRVEVKKRVGMERRAIEVMGDDFRCDELDDRPLMVTVLDRIYGPGKDKDSEGNDRSDDYVRAMFDSACDSFTKGQKALDRVDQYVEDMKSKRADAEQANQRLDSKSARQKMIERNRSAWITEKGA